MGWLKLCILGDLSMIFVTKADANDDFARSILQRVWYYIAYVNVTALPSNDFNYGKISRTKFNI